MKQTLILLALGLLLIQPVAFAAGSSGGSDGGSGSDNTRYKKSLSFNHKKGQEAVAAKRFQKAIGYLKRANRETPQDADINNLLGYSYRKLGDFESSYRYYQRALKIDPSHLGANEYLGELYLQTDKLAKAEAQLKKLDKLCLWGCDEYTELKEAIQQYKSKN